ncbi:hypothetical protein LAZ67_16002264 [Cordylochernes scorpioides]|uniref:Uncharacterized protein n=1 Tax=Cordylochernes scorpioides TaxID=51811 RepID=A0ABY6LEG4_9ARAC|nr:hypothetical protein LAZ67_16002264 [Cordylochernes scorpioides]
MECYWIHVSVTSCLHSRHFEQSPLHFLWVEAHGTALYLRPGKRYAFSMIMHDACCQDCTFFLHNFQLLPWTRLAPEFHRRFKAKTFLQDDDVPIDDTTQSRSSRRKKKDAKVLGTKFQDFDGILGRSTSDPCQVPRAGRGRRSLPPHTRPKEAPPGRRLQSLHLATSQHSKKVTRTSLSKLQEEGEALGTAAITLR